MGAHIRHATAEDSEQLLALMRQLAVFEGYINDFKLDHTELLERGFPAQGEAQFSALVAAEDKDNLLRGMLVYYLIPFTYDLRPTLFIKELFVVPDWRGQHIGQSLFEHARAAAQSQRCGRIKWDVLTTNHRAHRFYQRMGARANSEWSGFCLELD